MADNLLGKFSKKKVLLTFHSQADLDAVASACALSFYLPSSAIFMQDNMNAESRKFVEKMGVKVGLIEEADISSFQSIILLDCNSLALAPALANRPISLIIDHHSMHSDSFSASQTVNIPSASSTCEVLYSLIPKNKLNAKIATCLLAGIISDTANMRSAGAETFSIVSFLLQKSHLSYSQMLSFIHLPTDISQRYEMMRAMRSVEFERKGERIVATSIVNSFESHVASTLVHAGADIAFAAHKGKKELRISARVSEFAKEKVDLAKIMRLVAQKIGGSGGGHPYAAGLDAPCPQRAEEALGICRELALERV